MRGVHDYNRRIDLESERAVVGHDQEHYKSQRNVRCEMGVNADRFPEWYMPNADATDADTLHNISVSYYVAFPWMCVCCAFVRRVDSFFRTHIFYFATPFNCPSEDFNFFRRSRPLINSMNSQIPQTHATHTRTTQTSVVQTAGWFDEMTFTLFVRSRMKNVNALSVEKCGISKGIHGFFFGHNKLWDNFEQSIPDEWRKKGWTFRASRITMAKKGDRNDSRNKDT